MRRPMARLIALLFGLFLLAGCQLSLPGRGAEPGANPVTGGTITTTTLDAPAAAPAPAAAAAPAPAPAAAAAPPSAPAATAPATPDPAAIPEAAPAILKSPAQIACEADRGSWARAGAGGGMACIYQTRDGGKRCDSKDDCQGECLARSRTCAPIRPLFGCNAVLMTTGAEVTLCLD